VSHENVRMRVARRGDSPGLLELQKPVVRSSIVVGKCSCRGGEWETRSSSPLAQDSDV
jgi:hypothetical protein